MRLLRTLLSALCIVCGALSLVFWASGRALVSGVESGELVGSVVVVGLDRPAVVDAVANAAYNAAIDALAGVGVDTEAPGVVAAVDAAMATAARAGEFRQLVRSQAESTAAQLRETLTDPTRAPGPWVVEIDVTRAVNDRIDAIPAVGGSVPELSIAPIHVSVWTRTQVEAARTTFAVAQWFARYGGWLGAALVVSGIAVTPRRRWFATKLFAALAVGFAAAWFVVRNVDPGVVAHVLPWGDDVAVETLLASAFSSRAGVAFQSWAVVAAVGCAAAAVVVGWRARASSKRSRS